MEYSFSVMMTGRACLLTALAPCLLMWAGAAAGQVRSNGGPSAQDMLAAADAVISYPCVLMIDQCEATPSAEMMYDIGRQTCRFTQNATRLCRFTLVWRDRVTHNPALAGTVAMHCRIAMIRRNGGWTVGRGMPGRGPIEPQGTCT
jgi:hypothetical protein